MIRLSTLFAGEIQVSEKYPQQPFTNLMILILYVVSASVAIFVLFGCEPAVDPSRQFLIRKGDHYSSPKMVESMESNVLLFDAKFNETAVYSLGDNSVQSDVNKLMGFCDCNSQVHENSARFGWRWFNGQLEIRAYCYVNSVRVDQLIGVVDLNVYNRFRLERTENAYVFTLNGQEPVSIQRGNTCNTGVYMKLWPYFGGHLAAPQDVVINIKTLY